MAHVLAWPDLVERADAARSEPEEEIAELEVEF
jgi:hypothetical protein